MGAQIVEYGADRIVLEIPLRRELLQQFGFVHGGVISYAADNALTFAAGSALGPSIVTSGFSIDYLRPGRGVRLRAVATVVNRSRRQALCRCDVFAIEDDATAVLCAAAQGSARTIHLER
ncbi:PaaI family thioesterase [Rhodococcus qingshengii]|uniref:PaaI family thioesterase n=1 Tax=Rhodococcus qingshengii TaxID=334542 RepID=UPI002035CE2B|nr:PaaI family thioesterase [Rhodococcus qingshengii]